MGEHVTDGIQPIMGAQVEKLEAQVATIQRDDTLKERREDEYINEGYLYPTADPHGPGSQDLMTALGHWADWDLGTTPNDNGATKIKREQGTGDDELLQKRLAANAIHNHYMVQKPDDLNKLREHDVENTTELDLSSADSRVAVLDNLVQNTASDQTTGDAAYGEKTCAASALLGAAVLGGKEKGTEGITMLLDTMSQDPERKKFLEGDKDNPGVMTDIRKKIAAGEALSTGDMHLMQRTLYNELQAKETKDANARVEELRKNNASEAEIAAAERAATGAMDDGIQGGTIDEFMKRSPKFQQMMKDNEMSISFIQNDPNQKASNHAVLAIGNGGPHTIYDPQMRDDGQIVMDPRELENYKQAESAHINP